jgi:hypothetical protein
MGAFQSFASDVEVQRRRLMLANELRMPRASRAISDDACLINYSFGCFYSHMVSSKRRFFIRIQLDPLARKLAP